MAQSEERDHAGLGLLSALKARGYRFVCPTPASHARVISRPCAHKPGLRDVFGWSRPFQLDDVEPQIAELMHRAGVLAIGDEGYRSKVRVSSLGDHLFLHSAYPTQAQDAVFFGPDSYRFASFIRSELRPSDGAGVIADVGAGAGVGAVVAAERRPGATLVLTDVNAQALRLAAINAAFAGLEVRVHHTSGLNGIGPGLDAAIANPPFIMDPQARLYRHGGGMHGGQLSLDLARAMLTRLKTGGDLLLYTGSAIVDGVDPLCEALQALAVEVGASFRYSEIDPDVFGEELDRADYADVERIALVGVVMTRSA